MNKRSAEPRQLHVEVEYRDAKGESRWLTWTLTTDRPLRRVLASVQALHPDAHATEVQVVKNAAYYMRREPGYVSTPYRLPSGEVVQIDEEVARGAQQLDFTLRGGEIVMAERV
jgi:hypothetical protein